MYLYIYMYIYVFVCVCVYIFHIYIYIYLYLYLNVMNMYIYIHINMYIYIYIYVYIYAYIHLYIHKSYVFICVYVYVHVCIYIHIHIYINLYIYMYMYSYIYIIHICPTRSIVMFASLLPDFWKIFYLLRSTNVQNLVKRIRCSRNWSFTHDYAVLGLLLIPNRWFISTRTKWSDGNVLYPVRYQLPKGTPAGWPSHIVSLWIGWGGYIYIYKYS